jgi:hypothetical protein
LVVQHRFPLLLRKLDPETSISTPVPTRLFHRGSDYSHPRNLYSHARNPYSHPPGISIHIAPESVFTCPGIRTLRAICLQSWIQSRASRIDQTIVRKARSKVFGVGLADNRPVSGIAAGVIAKLRFPFLLFSRMELQKLNRVFGDPARPLHRNQIGGVGVFSEEIEWRVNRRIGGECENAGTDRHRANYHTE